MIYEININNTENIYHYVKNWEIMESIIQTSELHSVTPKQRQPHRYIERAMMMMMMIYRYNELSSLMEC